MTSKTEEYLNIIKKKIEEIHKHNEVLKRFNYKLEAFLASIDAYSIDEPMKTCTIPETRKLIEKPQTSKKIRNEVDLGLNKLNKVHHKEINLDELSRNFESSLVIDTKNEIINKALSDENMKKINKSHLIKIIDVLYERKEGIFWEDLIRESKVPKYKCIEILNLLVKTDPPIIIKKRDRGFTCSLNFL